MTDEKGRTPTYKRGVADGRNEQRAAESELPANLARISVWCRAIAQKARHQGNEALAATAPRIAEEIDRALAGRPLEYARDPDPDAVALVTWLREQGHDDPPPFAPRREDFGDPDELLEHIAAVREEHGDPWIVGGAR